VSTSGLVMADLRPGVEQRFASSIDLPENHKTNWIQSQYTRLYCCFTATTVHIVC
jgi:hypothetical protein